MKKITLLFALLTCGAFSARAHQDGDSIWNVSTIHDIYLDFSQAGYWDSLTNNYTTDTYMRCDMTFDGRLLPSCGVKFKGNSSYNNPSDKKSFKLDLNNYVSGQDYDGIKKFNLNNGFKDPTFLREKICLDFMRAHGVAAPRCTYARLYINNVYRGFYTLVEEVNSKFLKQHYPDNNGNLFKGDPSGDMRWYGSADSLYYTHYELHSNETANDWSDLVHLVNVVNNTSPSVYFDSLSNVLNAWSFLNYMAACNVFVNLDSYIGSGHNYFTYDDSTDLRFQWIAWDVNEAFGNFNMGMQIPQLQALPYNYLSQPINRPLANKMLADPTFHSMYISSLCWMMQDFNNAYLDPIIDSLANRIRTDVYADSLKFYTNQQFEDDMTMDVQVPGGPGGGWIPGLKNFIAARNASMTSQLAPFGCYLSVNEIVPSPSLSLFPNPGNDLVTVTLPSGWTTSNSTLHVFDFSGREILNDDRRDGKTSFGMDVSSFADGLYLVEIRREDGTSLSSRMIVSH